MAEPRTEAQVLAEMDELASKMDQNDYEGDLKQFQARQRELTNELSSIKVNAEMAKIHVQQAKDRNERVYNEVMKKNFGVDISDIRKDESKVTPEVRFYESMVFGHKDELAAASAQGESAVRQWMEKCASVVTDELDKFRKGAEEEDKKASADAGDDDGDDDAPERPEPTDISDIPDGADLPEEKDLQTPGSKAWVRLLSGVEVSDLDHALIGRDVEIDPDTEDPGLPTKDAESFAARLAQAR